MNISKIKKKKRRRAIFNSLKYLLLPVSVFVLPLRAAVLMQRKERKEGRWEKKKKSKKQG
jgi:hypothetical protein